MIGTFQYTHNASNIANNFSFPILSIQSSIPVNGYVYGIVSAIRRLKSTHNCTVPPIFGASSAIRSHSIRWGSIILASLWFWMSSFRTSCENPPAWYSYLRIMFPLWSLIGAPLACLCQMRQSTYERTLQQFQNTFPQRSIGDDLQVDGIPPILHRQSTTILLLYSFIFSYSSVFITSIFILLNYIWSRPLCCEEEAPGAAKFLCWRPLKGYEAFEKGAEYPITISLGSVW